MTVQYVNRKGRTYYLHRSTTKTGKTRYYISPKSEGDLVETMPAGYEVYENVNGQVYVRASRPKAITDEEVRLVKEEVERRPHLRYCQVDVKGKMLRLHMPDQNIDGLAEVLRQFGAPRPMEVEGALEEMATYSPEMQFELVEKEKRLFVAHRYCYLGSVDEWTEISGPDSLKNLAKKFVKHLGRDSFFELY